MSEKATFTLKGRNPDVLTSISNLSNDEVFTPPELANRMLDVLEAAWASSHNGESIWQNSSVKFLDPFTKSGVFLREITKRLVTGLESEIPDLQSRVNHVLTRQVFGIAVTQLTALLSRRSVYCAKNANGEHSICNAFSTDQGNIWYERSSHSWVGGTERQLKTDANGHTFEEFVDGRCQYCSAPRKSYDRGDESENYAYAFIHAENPQALLDNIFGDQMKFDVVIGNPPYQLSGGSGGTSDASIYHLFVQQAKRLEPKFISMIIPSRWIAGGRGLDDFRQEMLGSGQISSLVDYPNAKDVFPGSPPEGGVGYFLWDRSHKGPAQYSLVRGSETVGPNERNLSEFPIFIRDEKSVRILRKIAAFGETSITEILTADTPFGIATNFREFADIAKPGDVALHYSEHGRRGVGYLPRSTIKKNEQLIDQWKLLAPEANGIQGAPDVVLGKPWLVGPGAICTQTFLTFFVNSENEASNLQDYYATKFFRFLVSLRKITQHALRSTYTWVPMQDFQKSWTDTELYEKYGLSKSEIEHIEVSIREMTIADG